MNWVNVGGVFENMFPRSDVSDFLGDNVSEIKSLFLYDFEPTTIQNETMSCKDSKKTQCRTDQDIIQWLPLLFSLGVRYIPTII
jgi:hypothetical protein